MIQVKYMKEVLIAPPLGSSMRLGNYKSKLLKNSKNFESYKNELITERHRHRYEVSIISLINNFENTDLLISGNIIKRKPLRSHRNKISSMVYWCSIPIPKLIPPPRDPNPIFLSFVKSCISEKLPGTKSLQTPLTRINFFR